GQLLLQQVVDHRARQQLVLAADAEPDRVADAVRQGLGVAAEGRDEAARRQLQRADRLERAVGEVAVEVGEVERSGEAEERQVAEEHSESRERGEGRWETGDGKRMRVGRSELLLFLLPLPVSRLPPIEPRMRIRQRAIPALAQCKKIEQGRIAQLR